MARIKNIRQLVWLVSTIKKEGRITLNDLNQKWIDEEIADGNHLARSSFNHYRDDIFDLFGLVMSSERMRSSENFLNTSSVFTTRYQRPSQTLSA